VSAYKIQKNGNLIFLSSTVDSPPHPLFILSHPWINSWKSRHCTLIAKRHHPSKKPAFYSIRSNPSCHQRTPTVSLTSIHFVSKVPRTQLASANLDISEPCQLPFTLLFTDHSHKTLQQCFWGGPVESDCAPTSDEHCVALRSGIEKAGCQRRKTKRLNVCVKQCWPWQFYHRNVIAVSPAAVSWMPCCFNNFNLLGMSSISVISKDVLPE